jgi:WD40 repeat protein
VSSLEDIKLGSRAFTNKPKVFISYSRRDSSRFANELLGGLRLAGFDPKLDTSDIAKGEPWEDRLSALIKEADSVIFVLSPEAAKSERCGWEVDQAIKASKRLLPVVWIDVQESDVSSPIKKLNYIHFNGDRLFTEALTELSGALRKDILWIREHTRYADLSQRWLPLRPDDLLLRGQELLAAHAWMARLTSDVPPLTAEQITYINASEEAETARKIREDSQIDVVRKAQRLKGRLLLLAFVSLLSFLTYLLALDYQVTQREQAVFTSIALKSYADQQYERGMRYALQAYPQLGGIPWAPLSEQLHGTLASGAIMTHLRATLAGHTASVTSIAFDPTGRLLATSSDDGTARIWDGETVRHLLTLKGHSAEVNAITFSPDGKLVLTASSDKTARIWDAQTGRERSVLRGHVDRVFCVAFSPDGVTALTSSQDMTARLWNASTGLQIQALEGHTARVTSASFSPNSMKIITGSNDLTARVWDYKSGRQLLVLNLGGNFVATTQFSPDSKKILTAAGGLAQVWDAESGGEDLVLKGHSLDISSATFSPDGKQIVTAGFDQVARLWDAGSGKEAFVFKGHTGPLTAAVFSPDAQHLVTTSADKTARLWDLTDSGDPFYQASKKAVILNAHDSAVGIRSISPDGRRFATFSFDSSARLWSFDPIGKLKSFRPTPSAPEVTGSFVVDDARIVIDNGPNDQKSNISAPELEKSASMAGAMFYAALSPDSKKLITAHFDTTARLWDIGNHHEIAILKGHQGSVLGAAFSPDGTRIITASVDNSIRMWDGLTGEAIKSISGDGPFKGMYAPGQGRLVGRGRMV